MSTVDASTEYRKRNIWSPNTTTLNHNVLDGVIAAARTKAGSDPLEPEPQTAT